jgi:hypothetical protein
LQHYLLFPPLAFTDGGTYGQLVLDLHDIYNRGAAIDGELERVINDAVEKKNSSRGDHPR